MNFGLLSGQQFFPQWISPVASFLNKRPESRRGSLRKHGLVDLCCSSCEQPVILWVIMADLCNRGSIIFLPCDFYLSIYLVLFSSLNLSGRRLDVYHTLTHGVALV